MNNTELLTLTNITKSFDGINVLDDVSATFEAEKITCLIGPNGAGKTTLFNIISGFLFPNSGKIVFKGKEIANGIPVWQRAQLGIGRLFQDVRVFEKLTVLENLLLAKKGHIGENPLISLCRPFKIRETEKEYRHEAEKWLNFVGLQDKINSNADNLSYGQQKLLVIARLLMGGFDLLLLDEPTAGINPSMVDIILNVIKNLVAEGKTVVIIEHNMNIVTEVSHWVFFMDAGKITAFGLPEEVLGDPTVREAYLGM